MRGPLGRSLNIESSMRSVYILVCLLFPAHGLALPQAAARYRASPDTLRYTSLNSYLMYFVRGADTLGQPVTTQTLELRRFEAAESGLRLWVRLEGTGQNSFRSEQTYTITPSGRVLTVNGRPVSEVPNARVDVLPRFSAIDGSLEAGSQWTDTVSAHSTQSYGPTFYNVRRTYRVLRVIDTLSSRLAVIVAQGEMQLRQGGWQDSVQSLVWWQEVAGPATDTVWFDAHRGHIVTSVAVLNLTGSGGVGPRGSKIVMPSGLRSSIRLEARP